MRKYDNVLFDFDGTLVKSERGVIGAVLYSLGALGIPPADREKLKVFIGPPLKASYMKFFGMSEEKAEEAIAHYRVYYNKYGVYENDRYDGLDEVLTALKKAGYRLAVATSKPRVFAEKILEDLGMRDAFDAVVGTELDDRVCDKATLIGVAIKALGGGGSVMIGDTVFDIEGAKKAGTDSIGVLYGYGKEEDLRAAGATYIAETAGDIPKILI